MPSSREFRAVMRMLLTDMDRSVAWRFGGTIMLVVAGGLLSGVAPLALKGMIDAATGTAARHDAAASQAIATFGTLYLLALCGGRLLAEVRPALLGAAEQRLYTGLRRRYAAHLLGLPLAFHLSQRTGSLVQTLHQAISGLQILLLNLINGVVPVLVELVTVTLVLASLEQPALMTTFAATALAYFAVLSFRKTGLRQSARAVSDASIEAHAILADSLVNIETIKCFNAAGGARDVFGRAADTLERTWAALRRARLRLGVTVTATFAVSMAASLAVAIDAVLGGSLSLGGFVLVNVYMLQLARPLEAMGAAARDISQAMEFIRPLHDVFAATVEEPASTRGLPIDRVRPSARGPADDVTVERSRTIHLERRPAPCIAVHGLRFDYGANTVLDGLCLHIAAGRSVAIVGASGSGKSSLVRLLLRLYEPQAGGILLDGVATTDLPADEVRSQIALVPQDTVLFNATIAFNIGIGRAGATRHDVVHAARVARAHDFIVSMPEGYETVVGERGLKLSGGERQRIAIARAVLKDPRVFVFDEATSMLDALTERAILRDLREISAGRTTITIAHRLSTIQDADEILVLDRGKVAEQGDHSSLLKRGGAYAAMWRAQHRADPR